MPPRRRVPAGLTAEDLARLAAAVAAGSRVTVYLRDAVPGLGLPAATSARVVSVSGETVVARPKGVADALPFEAAELLARAPRAATSKSTPARSTPVRSAPVKSAPAEPSRDARPPLTPPSDEATAATGPVSSEPQLARAPRTRRAPAGAAASVTITLTGDADRGWHLTLGRGDRPAGAPVQVGGDVVRRAVAELDHAGSRKAVDDVLATARTVAARRVAALAAELAVARTALQDLTGEPPS